MGSDIFSRRACLPGAARLHRRRSHDSHHVFARRCAKQQHEPRADCTKRERQQRGRRPGALASSRSSARCSHFCMSVPLRASSRMRSRALPRRLPPLPIAADPPHLTSLNVFVKRWVTAELITAQLLHHSHTARAPVGLHCGATRRVLAIRSDADLLATDGIAALIIMTSTARPSGR